MNNTIKSTLLFLLCILSSNLNSQERKEPISYGDMDKWMVREIKESSIIGGNTKYIYSLADGDTLKNNTPYVNSKSPWATSSVLAKVKGITKASVTVFPEKRGEGYCTRLETRIENCKVLGLININVLASGTIFLGKMIEPITGTDNPQSKLETGIAFTKRPKALEYDYKLTTGGSCIRSTGFSGQKKLDQKDNAEVFILLQHRWEDTDGNIHAKRVATGWERFESSVEKWHNNHRLVLNYGDITSQSSYKSYMGLKKGDEAYYAKNSKGKMVPILEEGWATANESVTHLVLQFSSSCGGAYTGSPDSRFWIDNVGLIY